MKHRLMLLFTAILITLSILSAGLTYVEAEEMASVCRGEEITISVTLLQNGTYGDPVPYQEIEFFDQTNNLPLGTARTDLLGHASMTWGVPIDYQLGIITINATFRGNESLFLAPTSSSLLVHIMSSTTIHTNLSYVQVAPDDTVIIVAQLLDDDDVPVSEATIHIVKESQTVASRLTNSSGFAHFIISCNTSWLILGDNHVLVVHERNPSRHYDGCEEEIVIEMQQIDSSMTAANNASESVLLGSIIEYTIVLLSPEGPIANSMIQIMLDGNLILEILTDHQGSCSPTIPVDSRFGLGRHTLTVEYGGSDRYFPCSIVDTFSVTSPVNLTVWIPDQVVAGSTINVNITATDSLGRAITGLVLDFNDTTSGIELKAYFQPNSTQVTFTISIEGPFGNHTIVLLVSGNPYVDASPLEITVSVWSQPSFTLLSSTIQDYAWPGQDITLEFHLGDPIGCFANQEVTIWLDGAEQSKIRTNTDGFVSLSFLAPFSEQEHFLSLLYAGNSTGYQFGAVYDYAYTVTRTIPVVVHLENYEVLYPLKQIDVHVRTNGLNGSSIGGLRVHFSWFSTVTERTSSSDGHIVLHLFLPNHDGVFVLTYSVQSVETIDGMNGSLMITIDKFDILASEGLGLSAICFILVISTAVVAIPTLLRRIPMG